MAMQNVIALILGGGRGTRLHPLTKLRAKPAVPIGGKYRLIDIPISNCLNSDIHKIYVLTQFLSASLHRHIFQTYKFDLFSGGFVDILAAGETPRGMDWYQGTADAVRKQLSQFAHARVEDILILSGDHLYRMDYGKFIELHREKRADVTIAVQPVALADAPRFGILKTDEDGRITSFHEKPKAGELEGLECVPGSDQPCLASMGIYLFRPDALRESLEGSDAEDFGSSRLPSKVCAYTPIFSTATGKISAPSAPFTRPTWRSHSPTRPLISTIPPTPSIPARASYPPPAPTALKQTVLAEGCTIQQSDIRESVIGLRSIIGPDAQITRTVMMGADFYETPERKTENRRLDRPDVGVGRGSVIEGAIIDKNARIGEGVTIQPHDPGKEMVETKNYAIHEGIVVVPKNAVIPDGTVI